MLKFHSKHWC